MQQRKTYTVRRLEQILQTWEEMMWAMSLTNRALAARGEQSVRRIEGPLLHYGELRRHLLGIKKPEEFDIHRFLPTMHEGVSLLDHVPGLLSGWWTLSRRVYHLTPDLATLLAATSLNDLSWNDLEPPFESFGISLEEPIGIDGRHYDFFLLAPLRLREDDRPVFTKAGTNPTWYLSAFSTALDRWSPWNLRADVERRAQKDLDGAAMFLAKRGPLQRLNAGVARGVLINRSMNTTVDQFLDRLAQGNDLFEHIAWRIVAGLCMYLKMLPAKSPVVSDWKRVKRTNLQTYGLPSKNCITDESEICTVSSLKRLSDDERRLMMAILTGRMKGIELDCHLREGHWRRPPGTAIIVPEVEKTVHVHPTIVRLDRWTEGGPVGRQKFI